MRWVLMAALLAGCGLVPARVPPQLSHTPGPAVSFDEAGQVVLGVFAVPIPHGWRVIKTSTAQEPLRVVLASPDDTVLITAALTARVLDRSDLPIRREQTLTRSGETLHLIGQSTAEAAPTLYALWGQLLQQIVP
jgi:hypothetical protein